MSVAVLGLAAVFVWHKHARSKIADRHMEMACNTCHLGPAEVEAGHGDKMVASQEQLCSGCHRGAIEASHPSGFSPKRPLPSEFPVDWKGDLTCSTCHDIHNDMPGHMRVAATGRELCLACHAPDFFDDMRDNGASMVLSGHVDASTDPIRVIDRYSLRCMVCHAEMAFVLGSDSNAANLSRHGNGSMNHSIGADYQLAAIYGGYRPAFQLAQEILLPNGKTSCVSCHLGYSREHGRLARPRADLCFECHDL